MYSIIIIIVIIIRWLLPLLLRCSSTNCTGVYSRGKCMYPMYRRNVLIDTWFVSLFYLKKKKGKESSISTYICGDEIRIMFFFFTGMTLGGPCYYNTTHTHIWDDEHTPVSASTFSFLLNTHLQMRLYISCTIYLYRRYYFLNSFRSKLLLRTSLLDRCWLTFDI